MLKTKSLSMSVLFPACVEVLHSHLYPIHYQELTRKAIEKLSSQNQSIAGCSISKSAEDVREKLLKQKARGTFYTGKTGYMGAIQSWFPTKQIGINFDLITIPCNLKASLDGGFEAMMRIPYMKTKVFNSPSRYMGCVRGQIIEKHVAYWFRDHYPEIYAPPKNEGNWKTGCDHDFILKIPNYGDLFVDVMGCDKNGNYTTPKGKPITSVHLLCRAVDNSIIWDGCIRGSHERNHVICPYETFSPICFLVWLNCKVQGIDYHLIAKSIED